MPNNVEREVEEILRKLDKFVPEEGRLARTRTGAGQAVSGFLHTILARLSRVSLGQLMLTSLVLVLVAFFFRGASPALARWAIIGGLVLFLSVFVLSFLSGSSRHERRWRGRVVDLSEPSLGTRLRNWFQRRGRPR